MWLWVCCCYLKAKNIYLWAGYRKRKTMYQRERNAACPTQRRDQGRERPGRSLFPSTQSNLPVPPQLHRTNLIHFFLPSQHLRPVQISYQRRACRHSIIWLKISCRMVEQISHTGAHSLQAEHFEARHLLSQYSILILLRGHPSLFSIHWTFSLHSMPDSRPHWLYPAAWIYQVNIFSVILFSSLFISSYSLLVSLYNSVRFNTEEICRYHSMKSEAWQGNSP